MLDETRYAQVWTNESTDNPLQYTQYKNNMEHFIVLLLTLGHYLRMTRITFCTVNDASLTYNIASHYQQAPMWYKSQQAPI